jgi:hypothetical protein
LMGADAENGPWHPSPRFLLSQAERTHGEALNPDRPGDYDQIHFPGTVGYVNTDMYDFGAGLDIRESPKELRERMSKTLVDRLQIVGSIGEVEKLPISDMLRAVDDQKYPIMRQKEVREGWEDLFGDEHEFKTGAVKSADGELRWSRDDDFCEFISSGENQAFFLLSYLENLHWRGSILILDEPEIHLSLAAASRLMNRILDTASRRRTQVIIVTHLPHLYRSQVARSYDWQTLEETGSYQLAYLVKKGGSENRVSILEEAAALRQASIDSHLEALAVVNDLRATETPGIFLIRDAIRTWWLARQKRKAESAAAAAAAETLPAA